MNTKQLNLDKILVCATDIVKKTEVHFLSETDIWLLQ